MRWCGPATGSGVSEGSLSLSAMDEPKNRAGARIQRSEPRSTHTQCPVLMTLEREVIDSGRSVQISATTMPDGHTSILLRTGPIEEPGRHELSGVIGKEDLPILARVLKPELASIAAWQGITLDERADGLAERRRTYPNAYAPWNEEQERVMLEMHDAGKPTREIARALGRSPNAITTRLEELATAS